MKKTIFTLLAVFTLSSCNDEKIEFRQDLPVGLYVEVGETKLSKTVTDIDGYVTFSGNDQIGLFVPERSTPVVWKYENSDWTTSETVFWKNRTDDFEFHAYYPCDEVSGVTLSSVPMPDLTMQTGSLAEIGKYDFLAGSCTTSYSTNNGLVTFVKDNSLKHVYSLLYLNINGLSSADDMEITGCKFSGEGIVTPHVYSFESAGMVRSGNDIKSDLDISGLSYTVTGDPYTIAVLINPVTLNVPLNFTLEYNKGGLVYEASADLGKSFAGGSFNNISLILVDEKLQMSGIEVDKWNVITLDDVYLIGGEK